MNRKVLLLIISGIFSAASVFMGLWFMGVVSFADCDFEKDGQADEKQLADESDYWEIIYGGMKIMPKIEAKVATVSRYGCVNIRITDDYLIQIQIEDNIPQDFWNIKDKRMEELKEDGYRIELEPEQVKKGKNDYIRYIVSLEDNADDKDTSIQRVYSEVFYMKAGQDRRFLVVAVYDGIDMESLDAEKQNEIYQETFDKVEQILGDAEPTDKPDDSAGTVWMSDELNESNGLEKEYLSHDFLYDKEGNILIGYNVPEKCYLSGKENLDKISYKHYFEEEEEIYITTDVNSYAWSNAEESAKRHAAAGFSKIINEGSIKVGDETFYYYTYSVMKSSKKQKKYIYYFEAYADLEDGEMYSISAFANDNKKAMDVEFYKDFMEITRY